MNTNSVELLLADDDADDCLLFQEALEEYPFPTNLTVVHDGEQLISLLLKTKELPSALFLDLNMPRKNGFECLSEMKVNERLRHLPVIIISTSFNRDIVGLLYDKGANYYIRKPNDFGKLKKVIYSALSFTVQTELLKPTFEDFVLDY
jgi:CheY-like chemotaxis protein